MFLLKPFLAEEVTDVCQLHNVVERTCLSLQVTAFQTDDAVGQGVALRFGNVLPDNLLEVG